jgi:hypothetical protein
MKLFRTRLVDLFRGNYSRYDVKSSYIGLFWFSRDYSKIDYQVADKEFTRADVIADRWITPEGEHLDYKSDFTSLPRGRIGLEGGVVKIYVGTKCPDSAINLIKRSYGLAGYKAKVSRADGWNSYEEGNYAQFV